MGIFPIFFYSSLDCLMGGIKIDFTTVIKMKTVRVVEELDLVPEEILQFIKNCPGEICESLCTLAHICEQIGLD